MREPADFTLRRWNVDRRHHHRLHLKITHSGGTWQCAEINSERTLGYGKYIFQLDSPPDFDPNVVLGLFTWSDNNAFNNREIDIEIARWGDASDLTNAQFVVQP